jgi:hypothetical protein
MNISINVPSDYDKVKVMCPSFIELKTRQKKFVMFLVDQGIAYAEVKRDKLNDMGIQFGFKSAPTWIVNDKSRKSAEYGVYLIPEIVEYANYLNTKQENVTTIDDLANFVY